jgi:hypothetical protein
MKYILTVGNSKVLMDNETLSKIGALLDGCEVVTSKYVGKPKSETGYVTVLDKPKLADLFSVTLMSQTEYDALVVFTEVQNQEKS